MLDADGSGRCEKGGREGVKLEDEILVSERAWKMSGSQMFVEVGERVKVEDLIRGIIAYLPNVIVAVIILVIAAAVAKVVTDILSATLGSVQGGTWMARGAGMAILIAALCADGQSEIHNVRQIDRGYERIDERLRDLGARIERVEI